MGKKRRNNERRMAMIKAGLISNGKAGVVSIYLQTYESSNRAAVIIGIYTCDHTANWSSSSRRINGGHRRYFIWTQDSNQNW
jgi:hypothetical protein